MKATLCFLAVCLFCLNVNFAFRISPLPSKGRSLNVIMKDFPKPVVENTQNYQESRQLSEKFKALNGKGRPRKVAIIGGGLSGLACAKYLVDAGHIPIVYEARDVLGGKVSAWKDKNH